MSSELRKSYSLSIFCIFQADTVHPTLKQRNPNWLCSVNLILKTDLKSFVGQFTSSMPHSETYFIRFCLKGKYDYDWLTDSTDILLYIYETIINDDAFCPFVSKNILLHPLNQRCRKQIKDDTYCSAVDVFVLSSHKKVL